MRQGGNRRLPRSGGNGSCRYRRGPVRCQSQSDRHERIASALIGAARPRGPVPGLSAKQVMALIAGQGRPRHQRGLRHLAAGHHHGQGPLQPRRPVALAFAGAPLPPSRPVAIPALTAAGKLRAQPAPASAAIMDDRRLSAGTRGDAWAAPSEGPVRVGTGQGRARPLFGSPSEPGGRIRFQMLRRNNRRDHCCRHRGGTPLGRKRGRGRSRGRARTQPGAAMGVRTAIR